nr:hypothetical protein [Nannocystis pusilla]
MSPGARGLMLVAMLAALASTIDTHLNWGASYWSHDIYGRLWCEALCGRKPSGRDWCGWRAWPTWPCWRWR